MSGSFLLDQSLIASRTKYLVFIGGIRSKTSAPLFMRAPFASGPKDLASLDYYYQVNSPYLVDYLNTQRAVGMYGKHETWPATISYLANLRPGVYLTLGLNYTANPSQANSSQRFEENALNFQATLFTAF